MEQLKEIRWDHIQLLSLDIFDTLLLRAVAEFDGIFSIVWEKALERDIAQIDISPMEYKKLRIEMERRARNKTKNREIFFQQIFEEMPDYIAWDKKELAKLEYETEKEYCYINTDILNVIEEAKKRNIKIVLTSDMYFSKKEILEILSYNHFPTEILDDVLVSCDYGRNKQSGGLYDALITQYPSIKKENILHIGDNRNSDYQNALSKGIQAIHYNAIPTRMHSIYDYEKIRHNTPLPELLSLRKTTVYAGTEAVTTEKNTAYEIGASIVGPFLTLYISWVVEHLQKLNIHRIYPLMREGYLLGELLKKEADDRNFPLDINTINVSRKVTYLPAITHIDQEEIENMIGARNLTIEEAIQLMGLQLQDFGKFAPYYDRRLKESHDIPFEEDTLKNVFIQEMLLPQHVEKMETYIREQRRLLNTYLKEQIGDFKKAATIDVGFFGRIQMWMEQSLHTDGIETNLTHFLAIGITGDKIYNGYHFEGYSSTTTENSDLVTTIHRTTDVLEKLISVTEGSTIGYQEVEKDNIIQIEPVKGNPVENRILPDVFAGIFDFQGKWFDYRRKKSELAENCVAKKREALMILHRLIDMPRKAEAELFTTVQADTNFGTNYAESIITQKNIQLLQEKGTDYVDKCNVSYTYENSNIVWPKGLITLQDEFYYVRKVLKEKSQNEIMKSMQEVVERVQADGVKEVALYGAGENGRQFLFICNLYGIKVNCFIDRKESLWGTQKEGVPVVGLQEAAEKKEKSFIITSLFSIAEIKNTIIGTYQNRTEECAIYCV